MTGLAAALPIAGAIAMTAAALPLRAAPAPPVTAIAHTGDKFLKAHLTAVDEFSAKKTVHDPVCQGKCSACHEKPDDPKRLKGESPALCFTCHQDRAADAKKAHVHPPFAGGECAICHDPHASDRPRLLNDEVNALCTTCHQPDAGEIRKAHGGIVVAEAKCTECHTPHGSDQEHLLTEAPKHPPFESGSCDACHAEPGSDGKPKFNEEGGKLCFGCHGDHESLTEQPSVHPPFAAEQCPTCHSPHASRFPKFLRAEPPTLCRTCHEDVPDRGHPVGRHPTHKDGRRDPVRHDRPFDCVSCHDPHAAGFPQLRRAAPEAFCLMCHGTRTQRAS